MEEKVYEYFDKIESMGGVLESIKKGFFQKEIAESAYRLQKEIEEGKRVLVGVNKYVIKEEPEIKVLKIPEYVETRQIRRVKEYKKNRDMSKVESSLNKLRAKANEENLMPYIIDAIKNKATLGEIVNALKEVWGEYVEPIII
jgi:methylmalonyl-CoA mutase N-terminal domain/subunit